MNNKRQILPENGINNNYSSDLDFETITFEGDGPLGHVIMGTVRPRVFQQTVPQYPLITRDPYWRRKSLPHIKYLKLFPLKAITRINHTFDLAGHYRITHIYYQKYGKCVSDGFCILREDYDCIPFVGALRAGLERNSGIEHDVVYRGIEYHIDVEIKPSDEEKKALYLEKTKHVKEKRRSNISELRIRIPVETGIQNNFNNHFSLNKLSPIPQYFKEGIHWVQKQYRPAHYVCGIDYVDNGVGNIYRFDANALRIWLNQKKLRQRIIILMENANKDRKRCLQKFFDTWALYSIALIYINWSWHSDNTETDREWLECLTERDLRQYAILTMVGLRPHSIDEANKHWLRGCSMDFALFKVVKSMANKMANGLYKTLRIMARGNRCIYPKGYNNERRKFFKDKRGIVCEHTVAFSSKQQSLDAIILKGIEAGKTHAQIAEEAGCSTKTIARHLKQLNSHQTTSSEFPTPPIPLIIPIAGSETPS